MAVPVPGLDAMRLEALAELQKKRLRSIASAEDEYAVEGVLVVDIAWPRRRPGARNGGNGHQKECRKVSERCLSLVFSFIDSFDLT